MIKPQDQKQIPMLSTYALNKSYSGKQIIKDLSFEIFPGEVVGLLGPNGAGKTTTFYITMGLARPDSGRVFFNGKDISSLTTDQRAIMGMGYLAQEPSVFRFLTVEENILCILELQNLTKIEQQQRLEELLGELHLQPLAKKYAYTLSGGERRRLEITRALAINPTFLLLDEPFANIDPISIQEVKIMVQHLKEKNISVFITDHNAREIFSIVDRSYLILSGGGTLISGTVEELLADQDVRNVYLGTDFKM